MGVERREKKCGREVRVRPQTDRAAYKLFHSGRGEKRFLKIRQVKKNEGTKKKKETKIRKTGRKRRSRMPRGENEYTEGDP